MSVLNLARFSTWALLAGRFFLAPIDLMASWA
jgi:hypothetical protein